MFLFKWMIDIQISYLRTREGIRGMREVNWVYVVTGIWHENGILTQDLET